MRDASAEARTSALKRRAPSDLCSVLNMIVWKYINRGFVPKWNAVVWFEFGQGNRRKFEGNSSS
jgi:hypothetical protein